MIFGCTVFFDIQDYEGEFSNTTATAFNWRQGSATGRLVLVFSSSLGWIWSILSPNNVQFKHSLNIRELVLNRFEISKLRFKFDLTYLKLFKLNLFKKISLILNLNLTYFTSNQILARAASISWYLMPSAFHWTVFCIYLYVKEIRVLPSLQQKFPEEVGPSVAIIV